MTPHVSEGGSELAPSVTLRQLIGEVGGGKYGDLAAALGDGFHCIEPGVFIQRVEVAGLVVGLPRGRSIAGAGR